jgi:hypothetical protein
MDTVMAMAGLAAVMALSLPLALAVMWLCLFGAFHLLPHSPRRVRAAAGPVFRTAAFRWPGAHSKGLPRAFKAGLDR